MSPVITTIIAILEAALPGIEQAVLALIKTQSGQTPTKAEAQALRDAAAHAEKLAAHR
jgi:hypothetical protein